MPRICRRRRGVRYRAADALDRDDLRRAQEHIEQALGYISIQEQRIRELQREGLDTGDAEELLSSLRQTLILLIRHKTLIERDLK